MATDEDLLAGAEEWLASGTADLDAGRLRVAFECFRHAAELAAKVLLLRVTGRYPRDHSVAGPLAKAGALPATVDGGKLHSLLSRFTLGTYDFDATVHRSEAVDAKRLAERMVKACRR